MESSELSRQTAKATRWSTLTELALKCVQPVTSMILARLLTPEAFGVVATVSMIVSFADMFTDAGFQKYLIQHSFKDQDTLDRHTNVAFWSNLAFSLLLWGVITLLSDPLATMVGNPGMGNVIIVASLSLPLTAFSSIQTARFRRDFDFKTLFFIRLATAAVPLVVTVPLALILRSYWALIIGTLVSNGVNALVLTLRSRWKPKWYFNWKALREMFSYSWWILLESIAVWLTSYIGTFVVGVYLTDHYLGLYKTAMSTANQIFALITAATSAPLFVALSRLKDDRDSMQDTYLRFIGGLGVFMVPLGVGMWLYQDLLTEIALGSQWLEAAGFLGLWGLVGSVSLLLGSYCNGLYNAKGKTYLSFLTQVLHLVILVPALLWAAPKGFTVLWVTRCVLRLQLVLVQQIVMAVCMKISVMKQIVLLLPSMLCSAIMALAALGLQQLGDAIWWQAVSVLICMVVYFGVYGLLFRKKLIHGFKTLGFYKK